MHGRSENRGLLHVLHLLERPHQLHGMRGMNLENRPIGKHLLQLVRCADCREPAGVDDRNAMAVLGLVEVMSRDEDGDAASRQLLDKAPELAAGNRIDASCRLVQKDDSRLVENRAAERQPLSPSAGEIARHGSFPACKAGHLDRQISCALNLIVAEPVQRAEETDVLIDRQQLV